MVSRPHGVDLPNEITVHYCEPHWAPDEGTKPIWKIRCDKRCDLSHLRREIPKTVWISWRGDPSNNVAGLIRVWLMATAIDLEVSDARWAHVAEKTTLDISAKLGNFNNSLLNLCTAMVLNTLIYSVSQKK